MESASVPDSGFFGSSDSVGNMSGDDPSEPSPNRFRSRLPAMTRGINRRQFHNRLRRPPRTVTRGINRNPHSRPRMPTRGIASPSPSRNHNRKSRPRMTNTR